MTQGSSDGAARVDLTREDSPVDIRSTASPRAGQAPNDSVVEFEADDFMTDDEFQAAWSSNEGIWNHSGTYQTPQQVPTIARETYSLDGRTYRAGKTVELDNGDFQRMATLLEDQQTESTSLKGLLEDQQTESTSLKGLFEDQQTESTSLKGLGFQRWSKHHGLSDQPLNELVMNLSENNTRNNEEADAHTVPLSEVHSIRDMVVTSAPYPEYGCKEDIDHQGRSSDVVRQHCRVVCRWKILVSYKPHAIRGRVRAGECILRVIANEADINFRRSDQQSRVNWRGVTVKGGSCSRWHQGEQDFDRAEHARVQSSRGQALNAPLSFPEQRYPFGDAFCGAGGASRGAKAAGFRVEWGFDFDPAAIESYTKNFFAARCEATPADVFISSINEDFRIDVLHISPCCQPYSPLHTRPGPNDERNEATMFAVGELIRKTKPRIVVLENTFGLAERHLDWLHAMVQTFTSLGFSIRWRVMNLAEYGLAQARRRLIVFASCPGEHLPNYPLPTHGPGLRPFTTINTAISRIPRGFADHSPESVPKRNVPPYNGDSPLRNCITTGGSLDIHPSGTRAFTNRELACLQGFPLEHVFGARKVKMQIGNAVPPSVFKVFLEHLKEFLKRADS
ncbi:MAG: hypothetical protein Q9183_001566 [Haloplaca sp. 2 TL-2023]